MIPEIGHVALILALGMAIIQAVFPVIGAHRGINSWVALARPVVRTHKTPVYYQGLALRIGLDVFNGQEVFRVLNR